MKHEWTTFPPIEDVHTGATICKTCGLIQRPGNEDSECSPNTDQLRKEIEEIIILAYNSGDVNNCTNEMLKILASREQTLLDRIERKLIELTKLLEEKPKE